jgi:hypothetical protein
MSGSVAVWGCAVCDGVVYETDDPNEIEFYSVYKTEPEGLWEHLKDFKSLKKALVFGRAIAALDGYEFRDYTKDPLEFP